MQKLAPQFLKYPFFKKMQMKPSSILFFSFLLFLVLDFEAKAQKNGKALYEEHCSSCHKKNGKGMMRIYPPLLDSQWLQTDSTLIQLVLNGLKGEILVKGRTYNKEMPSFAHLDDEGIAAILSYIKKEFGNIDSMIDIQKIKETRTLLE